MVILSYVLLIISVILMIIANREKDKKDRILFIGMSISVMIMFAVTIIHYNFSIVIKLLQAAQ